MKRKLLIVGLPLVVALASASADAAVRSFPHSGVGCIQAVGTQMNPDGTVSDALTNTIERTQYGVHNTSTTSPVTVECPLNVSYFGSNSPSVSGFSIKAYDRNPSSDVNCNMQRIDGNGNVSYTAALTTSNSGAGVQDVSVLPTGVTILGTWRLRCSIPATVSGGGGFNHLVSYSISVNE